MFEEIIRTLPGKETGFHAGYVHINMERLCKDFAYCGLWYARDSSEKSIITTELYFSRTEQRSSEPADVIKESVFKQSPRYRIPCTHQNVWISARISEDSLGGIKVFDFHKERAYINCKIIKSRQHGVDAVQSGIIRGGDAYFAKIGIEDMIGEIDYNDTILYLVLIAEPPPADWEADAYIGVGGLPVVVPVCKFSVDRKYPPWNGQNPLDGIGS